MQLKNSFFSEKYFENYCHRRAEGNICLEHPYCQVCDLPIASVMSYFVLVCAFLV